MNKVKDLLFHAIMHSFMPCYCLIFNALDGNFFRSVYKIWLTIANQNDEFLCLLSKINQSKWWLIDWLMILKCLFSAFSVMWCVWRLKQQNWIKEIFVVVVVVGLFVYGAADWPVFLKIKFFCCCCCFVFFFSFSSNFQLREDARDIFVFTHLLKIILSCCFCFLNRGFFFLLIFLSLLSSFLFCFHFSSSFIVYGYKYNNVLNNLKTFNKENIFHNLFFVFSSVFHQ